MASWARLEGGLGRLFGRLGGVLQGPWGCLRTSSGVLGVFLILIFYYFSMFLAARGSPSWRLGGDLGPFGGCFRGILGHLGCVLGGFCAS